MKRLALLLATSALLTACATAPRPVQVLQVCPKAPPLVLDAPVRDWQGQMRRFLQGTVPMPPDYSLPSKSAKLPTIR